MSIAPILLLTLLMARPNSLLPSALAVVYSLVFLLKLVLIYFTVKHVHMYDMKYILYYK